MNARRIILRAVAMLLAAGGLAVTRRRRLRPAIGTITVVALVSGAPLSRAASFEALGYGVANAVSADGRVVVGRSLSNIQAFRWTRDEGMVAIPGTWEAMDVSADGSVVVGTRWVEEAETAFRWTAQGGAMTLAGANHGTAYSVSANGAIVGGSTTDVAIGGWWHNTDAFRWTSQTGLQHLGSLPDSWHNDSSISDMSSDGSIMVGVSNGLYGDNWAAYWTEATGMMYISPSYTSPSVWARVSGLPTISGDGSVLYVTDGWGRSYRLTGLAIDNGILHGQTMNFQDLPGGGYCGISDTTLDGSVAVGNTRDGPGGSNQAMIWDAAHGIRTVEAMLESDYGLSLEGWQLSMATGISADGRVIVGDGIDPTGNTQAWLVEVPEPATLSLLALGGLAMLRRRRK